MQGRKSPGRPSGRGKAVSLPSVRASDVDIEHIIEGHTAGGARTGSAKTLFPDGWTRIEILVAVLAAYRTGKRVGTQGNRVKVRGTVDDMVIEMWVNLTTKRIETAYPV
jgi:hypothetical protein